MRSLAWSPKVHIALEYLPDLFDEDQNLKPPFIKKINREIEMFFRKNQLKISRKSQAHRKDALPYSLYFLKNEKTGLFHYFISPRKKTNSLGKGGEGYAVPLYELIKEKEIAGYTLNPNAAPALILKTFDKKLTFQYAKSDEAVSKLEPQKKEFEKKPDPKINSICYEQEEQFTTALWTQKSPALFSQGRNHPSINHVLHVPQPYFPGGDGVDFFNFYGGLLKNPAAYRAHFIQGLKFSIEAATKLKKLHDEGFLHCDIKLENMILDPKGSLRFIDTNKSRKISEPKEFDGFTAHYAPKEFLDSRRWTIEGETYAFGVCCYPLLGGQDLFKRSSRIDKNFLYHLKLDTELKNRITNMIENLLSEQPLQRKKLESVILELDLILGFIEGPSPGRTPSPATH